jgi:hypothetical protein
MGRKPINLKDQRFGKLTVKYRVGTNKHGSVIWLCECDCGNIIEVSRQYLKQKGIDSCGCVKSKIQERKTNIINDRKNGLSIKELVAKYKVTHQRIYAILKEYYHVSGNCLTKSKRNRAILFNL